MLFLHNIRLIDEPRSNAAGRFSGSVLLQTGWHPLRLYYRHAGDSPHLELNCRIVGGEALQLNEVNLRQGDLEP